MVLGANLKPSKNKYYEIYKPTDTHMVINHTAAFENIAHSDVTNEMGEDFLKMAL